MLKLEHTLKLDAAAIASPNLASRFDTRDLEAIGSWVSTGYQQDKASRSKWEKRTSAAMDLAMQIQKDKNFPWPNCANINFPLVTIAALQFHARAYPAIVSGTDVVRCRVIGDDPTGEKKLRADRISCHMSYQVLEEDRSWEEQQDRLLINIPIVGCAFKKSYLDPATRHNTSELVMAADLVLNYYAKSVESCGRKTHIIPLYRNEIYARVKRGTFCDVLDEAWYLGLPSTPATTQQTNQDRRQGVTPPAAPDETTPFIGLEQHCSLDLDGDGYAEPYIITIEEVSHCVLRIVTRFDREEDIERNTAGEVIQINAMEYFTKYPFIPSPDGGIYDIGFGVLLGPLNESSNSIINQLIDSGTMSVSAGGFLGRGAKIRGGVYTFAPFEWKRIDSTVDDINKAIFPLPVREPSAVLFQLLSLLINYTNRISGSTDLMVGENVGQNTPAQTADTMLEQGQKIYNSIFKRVWRAMKEEFKKLYQLNAIYMAAGRVNYGKGQYAQREDYLGDPNEVVPAADPNVTSDAASVQQAVAIKQFATSTAGYNRDEVERNVLKAMKVGNIATLFPGTAGQEPPKDPKVAIAEMNTQVKMQQMQLDMQQFTMGLQEEARLNGAKIMALEGEMQARLLDVQGDAEDRQVAIAQSRLAILKEQQTARMKQIDVLLKSMDIHIKEQEIERAKIQTDGKRMDELEKRSDHAAAA